MNDAVFGLFLDSHGSGVDPNDRYKKTSCL